jgi:acetyl-CoA synthetase
MRKPRILEVYLSMNNFSPVIDNQYNIGHICTRQQCDLGRAEKVAMRWISPNLDRADTTYLDLERASNRAANLLQALGVGVGERVFIFLPKMPEVYFSFLGILKIQAVAGVLFANFGEDALLDRLGDSAARVLITKRSFLRKIRAIWPSLPALEKVLVVDLAEDESERVLSFPCHFEKTSDVYQTPLTSADTPSVLHYTSGSTGKPKGVQHVHHSVLTQASTFRGILSVEDEDIYWCTADPGWVTGISYGVVGPWSQGITQVHFGGSYNAETWFNILENEKVNVWYTAPTALRMLMQEDAALYQRADLACLRHIFSVGEPLNPAVIEWGRRVLKHDIYDTWFQTETGAIMISNRPGTGIRPGSMGKPFPPVEAAILDKNGSLVADMQQGRLCLKAGWPAMFVMYLNRAEQYAAKFQNGYYDSGDMAYRDEEGYFWFVGRGDDVINTAGHLISPFEVESALLEVEEVAEAGVIGAPDELLWEKVVAYVHLMPGIAWTRELEVKLRVHVSNCVSSIATPQEIRVIDSIPKNKSGKIMRRVLKAWYTGMDAGDLSTLED